MKRTLTILGTIIGGIILIFGIVEGGRQMQWWGEPDELRAIKRESIVDGRLLGLELESRDENGRYNLLRKRLSPSVELVFKSDNPSRDYDRVIQFAKDDGWSQRDDVEGDNSWRARKYKGNDRLSLTVQIRESIIEVGVTSSAEYYQ